VFPITRLNPSPDCLSSCSFVPFVVELFAFPRCSSVSSVVKACAEPIVTSAPNRIEGSKARDLYDWRSRSPDFEPITRLPFFVSFVPFVVELFAFPRCSSVSSVVKASTEPAVTSPRIVSRKARRGIFTAGVPDRQIAFLRVPLCPLSSRAFGPRKRMKIGQSCGRKGIESS
jgi:hypothetical protein